MTYRERKDGRYIEPREPAAQSRPVQSDRAEQVSCRTVRRPTFTEIAEAYAVQIGAPGAPIEDKDILWDLARIMAEVRIMRPEAEVLIDGEKIAADVVCQVFATIGPDQAFSVIVQFRRTAGEVKRVRNYLRTMLYNSAFETFGQIERFGFML